MLPDFLDIYLMISRLPRRKADVRGLTAYGGKGWHGDAVRRNVDMVSVVEIMADRWHGRVGAWGCFRESEREAGVLVDV